ncbi:MAG: type II toxin-antitoxin system RelE/ParE family toxin [Planctomycetes bacterium]|nr:type II toxin-antitoxin system RelE/ParE family toxin [Planctomycetota bacterium]
MMPFRVILLPRAEADMEANAQWWATHHSIEQAAHWFEAIHDQLKSLERFPGSNGLSAENGDFPYEIRDKLLGSGPRPSYRAVFTIKDDTVYVLTVRRSAQDVIRPGDLEAAPAE